MTAHIRPGAKAPGRAPRPARRIDPPGLAALKVAEIHETGYERFTRAALDEAEDAATRALFLGLSASAATNRAILASHLTRLCLREAIDVNGLSKAAFATVIELDVVALDHHRREATLACDPEIGAMFEALAADVAHRLTTVGDHLAQSAGIVLPEDFQAPCGDDPTREEAAAPRRRGVVLGPY